MKMHCIRRTLWGVTGLTLWLFCFTSAAVPQRSEDLRLFPVSVHGRIGFVDSRGRIGIKAHLLDYIGEFGAGNDYVTAKDQNGLWGIIDRKGSWRVAPKFEYMSIISEGAVLIRESGLYKFIDLNGRIFTPGFDYARPFSCGMAAVNKDGMWGYIDHFGNQVIPLRFSFDEGFANRLPFISPVNDFTEGLAGVNENGTTRYIFSDGSVAFSLGQGMLGGEFNDGRAIVCSKDKFGIIDKNGRIVIEPSYDEIKPFSDGLAAV